jgi:hypothetical protein
MNPLASRKKLLIAESELNRAQMVEELQTMTDKIHSLASQARTVSSIASSAAMLIAGLASCWRKKESAPAAEKPSWLQTILKGAQLAGSLWSEFRQSRRDQGGI